MLGRALERRADGTVACVVPPLCCSLGLDSWLPMLFMASAGAGFDFEGATISQWFLISAALYPRKHATVVKPALERVRTAPAPKLWQGLEVVFLVISPQPHEPAAA